MEPLTHFLTGATLSRTGLNRKTPLATLTLVLAAEIPDIDVLLRLRGSVTTFAHHRGFTHTFLGAPVMAVVVIALVYFFYRWRRKRWRNKPGIVLESVLENAPRWRLLYAYALLGVLSHILLDFTTNYGIRPLDPFNYQWFEWDIVFIVEPLILVALLLALIAPWFSGLISGEIGVKRQRHPGRGSAITALVFIVLLWWVRDYGHRRAIALLNQQTYQDQEPLRVSASPYMLNPFKWMGIVETNSFFENLEVDTLSGEVDPQRNAVTLYKPEETPIMLAAKKSPLGRVFLDWARYPYVETEILEAPESGFIVHMKDLRFAYPRIKTVPLSITIRLDSKLNVVSQRMGEREER